MTVRDAGGTARAYTSGMTLGKVAGAATLLASALLATSASPARAHGCPSGNAWATAVHHHTDLTCFEALGIWRDHPSWRDEFPGNSIVTSWATKLPSPALAEVATEWCRITTVEKYRAPVVPFGDHVLFSVRMVQDFTYNGTSVSTGPATISPDTTFNGWRWHFTGVTPQDWYTVTPWHWAHTSERWSMFATDGVSQLGAVHSTVYTRIYVQGNGDWSTGNVDGLADCRNP